MSADVLLKQPWLAVFLSTLFPGAGQIYGGDRSRGIGFIFIFVFLFLIAATSFIGFLFLDDAETSRWSALISVIAGFIILILGIFVLFDAYKVTKKYNEKHQLNIETGIKKKPWLAVFLSHIFPGGGQFYNKQLLKGIAFVICAVLLYIVHNIFYPLFILLLPLYFFTLKDAFDSAEKINGTDQKFLKQGNKSVRIIIAFVLVIEFIPFSDIAKHFVQAYKFPSGSMMPTLLIGDYLLVDKISKDPIKRGDLIVFKYPEDPKRDFLKRVIGIGGDTIEAKDKKIYINGIVLFEPYIQHTDNTIRPSGSEPRDNFGPLVIPEDNFFVMGDNREQSYDSRYWGYVSKENVKGKAFKIYWSWDNKGNKIRWKRIGMRIR